MKRINNEVNPWILGKMIRDSTRRLMPVNRNVLKFRLSEIKPIRNCATKLTAKPVPVMIPICE
jgi:hypothetical protein